jgi:hypothetical protein
MTSDPSDEQTRPPEPEPDAAPETGPGAQPEEPVPTRRSGRVLRPTEAIDRLDRQWVDRRPIQERIDELVALVLTTPDDPLGHDYIGLMTGASRREIARACAAWLQAQLAADAVGIGEAMRPRVALVPSGGLWYVVRMLGGVLVVIDGPGMPTPLAAARAAYRRYQIERMRRAEQAAEAQEIAGGGKDDPSPMDSADGAE